MSTKFAVPFLVLGFAIYGCGSDSTNNTGKGGTTGGGGTTGAAGTSAAAGTTGAAGTAAAGTNGAAGTTAAAGRGGTTGTAGTTAAAGRGGTTGGGGTGGGTAGTSAAAGRGGTTGGGGTGGGTAGTSASAGRGGTMGGGGAGGTNPLPACTSTTATSPPMSAADYCAILFGSGCGTNAMVTSVYSNMGECVSMYPNLSMALRTCRSYHLCNAITTNMLTVHCPHAVGLGGQCAN